ncbi:unnamed protein product, partial [Rangifer tarandus platyrhynchus]
SCICLWMDESLSGQHRLGPGNRLTDSALPRTLERGPQLGRSCLLWDTVLRYNFGGWPCSPQFHLQFKNPISSLIPRR